MNEGAAVSRDYEPVAGQWYENLEEEESFRVLSVDEDSELVEIEYLDGDIEEIDLEAWHEMDLELTQEPEGQAPSWAGAHWRLGLVLEKQGRKSDAIAQMDSALVLQPDFKPAAADRKRLK